MLTPSIVCIAYVSLLLFFTRTLSLPVDANSRSKHYESAIAKDRSQLLPNGPEPKAMNWDITDHDRSQGEFNWNKQHHSSLSDESEDAGSVGSAFFDEIMNDRTFLEVLEFMSDTVGLDKHVESAKDSARKARKRTIHDSEETPDLPLEDDFYDYPDNIDDFHKDMPIKRRVSQDDENWNEEHHSSLSDYETKAMGRDKTYRRVSQPDESEDAGSVNRAFFDEIMNDRTSLEGLEFLSDNEEEVGPVEPAKYSARKARKRTIHDSEEIPDLPLEDDYYDYPDNFDYFHKDMPKIADTMDVMDVKLQDDELWRKIDSNVRNISDHPENLDLKSDRWAHRNQLRSDISKYLANKLTKKLNLKKTKVPWSKMKAGDIINWPPGVELKSTEMLDVNALKMLHVLAKKDQLDFTPEFLDRFKISPVTKLASHAKNDSKNDKWAHKTQLRSEVIKYLADKLAKKMNVPSMQVPWSKMKADDIINWPSDVEYGSLYKMNNNELKRVHKLATEDLLDYAPEFLKRIQLDNSVFIRDIETALCDKLNAKTNIKFRRVPWNIFKKGDIINWPEGIPFERLSRLRKKRLESLYKLREVFSFSKEFLQSLSNPSFDRNPTTSLIAPETVKH